MFQSDEHYWFDGLSHSERVQYERAITAIIAYAHTYYTNPVPYLHTLINDASRLNSPLVRAVLWRLQQELAPIPEDD